MAHFSDSFITKSLKVWEIDFTWKSEIFWFKNSNLRLSFDSEVKTLVTLNDLAIKKKLYLHILRFCFPSQNMNQALQISYGLLSSQQMLLTARNTIILISPNSWTLGYTKQCKSNNFWILLLKAQCERIEWSAYIL